MSTHQIASLAAMALLAVGVIACFQSSHTSGQPARADESGRVRVEFTGGHETDPEDRGRPVRLIAAALGVSPEVFREAFSHVRPAPAGTRPDRERVRENREVLMAVLGPLGVTSERLDEVSNHYRYNRSRGEMWPTEPAVAHAEIANGAVSRIELISGGAGYSSIPEISVPGVGPVDAEIQLSFETELATNGSIAAITLSAPNVP